MEFGNESKTGDDAFSKGYEAGEAFGKASAAKVALNYLGSEELMTNSSFSSFIEGFEKGKKRGALDILVAIFKLFDYEQEELIEKVQELTGCSRLDVVKVVEDYEKTSVNV